MKAFAAGLILGIAFQPGAALACAACYGQSDSPLALGMNWGIFSLLGVIACVLGGITSFFVYLGRKSSATTSGRIPETAPESKPEA